MDDGKERASVEGRLLVFGERHLEHFEDVGDEGWPVVGEVLLGDRCDGHAGSGAELGVVQRQGIEELRGDGVCEREAGWVWHRGLRGDEVVWWDRKGLATTADRICVLCSSVTSGS